MGRGRGNFWNAYGRGGRGGATATATAVATTTRATFNSEVKRLDNSCEINWIVDSGCTEHIINNTDYCENCIDLKEPINVYLGDKRSVKATKIGNVVSYFEAFGK